jgi:hypothetical protein
MEVQGRTLRIRPNRSAWGGYPGEGAGPLKIELSTHGLRGASVSGAGSISGPAKCSVSKMGSGDVRCTG